MDKYLVRKQRKLPVDDAHKSPAKRRNKASERRREGEQRSPENRTDDASNCATRRGHRPAEALRWRKLSAEQLHCCYTILYSEKQADDLLRQCEEILVYNSGQMAKVHVFGKWHDIPRKQVAHGDEGLSYTFSGKTVRAQPWNSLLLEIRDRISNVTGHYFNFVLINRYKDGNDHIGEHRDDEKDLVLTSPIASLSLGQTRDFVFRHADSRGRNAKQKINSVKIELEHGSLLMMNHPTNIYWYHSLPRRKNLPGVRINMTFRHMLRK